MSGTAAAPTGVLVMAHGTPADPSGIEEFYTRIRRGRAPTPALLAELTGRYQAIGGTSPLTARTRAQVDGLTAALEAGDPGRYVVRLGTKYVHPTIEEGVEELAGTGVTRVVGIVLTPHQSSTGPGGYLDRAEKAAAAADPVLDLVAVPFWHRDPDFPRILAARTQRALDGLDPVDRRRPAVLFTAHSLPTRQVADGHPYPDQVAETGAAVAGLLGFEGDPSVTWGVAWQSAGRTDEPWLGPDLLGEMDRLAADGASAVVVCPVGFVSDHLEILYDLDIEAKARAAALGVAFARTASLDDDPEFVSMLARVVGDAAGGAR